MLSKWQLLICFLKDTITFRCSITEICVPLLQGTKYSQRIVCLIKDIGGKLQGCVSSMCNRYLETVD